MRERERERERVVIMQSLSSCMILYIRALVDALFLVQPLCHCVLKYKRRHFNRFFTTSIVWWKFSLTEVLCDDVKNNIERIQVVLWSVVSCCSQNY